VGASLLLGEAKMKRTKMIVAAALALGAGGSLFARTLSPSSAQSASAQVAVAEQRTTLAIENMTCALCPVTVKKAIGQVPGVKSVAVDFTAKTAIVVFDPSRTTIAAIAAASTNAGYPAHAAGS
jgi:mercuric ion binding protein